MTVMYKEQGRSEIRDSCRLCMEKSKIAQINIPYIFKYFVTQLIAVNINLRINFEDKMLK